MHVLKRYAVINTRLERVGPLDSWGGGCRAGFALTISTEINSCTASTSVEKESNVRDTKQITVKISCKAILHAQPPSRAIIDYPQIITLTLPPLISLKLTNRPKEQFKQKNKIL